MKVLYIGVYRDSTGWAHMAINSIRALLAAGVDVTARPVKLNTAKVTLPEAVLEAEAKPGGKFDAVIQNLLPHSLDYCGKIPLNVAYYCTETNRFDGTNWPAHINTMDQAWVCNQQSQAASRCSGVKIPTRVVPIACDLSKYQRHYKPLLIRDRLADSFLFYYIGDFNKRKNLIALIKAFHLEFDVTEPVNLVIKTNIATGPSDDFENVRAREAITQEINNVKREMKLYRSMDQYKQEIILTGHYTEEEIMRLHTSCDCFVCPSFGEAWCLPAFDAMAVGKTPIVTANTGFLEYMTEDTGWLVDCRPEPVWGMSQGTFEDLFTSREQWWSADVYHLMRCMREAYENKDLRQKKSISGRRRAYDFSYEKIGKSMLQCLRT